MAADASYAPNEFFASDGKTIVGMDADLSDAIAAEMGLKAKLVNETFDGIIPGLAAGKYDMGASSFTDTKEREKTVDFVDYFSAGESFFTKASGGAPSSTLADICGKTVAVEKGTTEETDAQAQSKKCGRQAGEGALVPRPERRQPGALLRPRAARLCRLASGRLRGQEVKRAVQARRPDVRRCPLRAGAPQEQRPRSGRAGRASRRW